MKSSDCALMGIACPSCNSCSTGSSDPACSGQTADGCYCVRNWPVLGVEALTAAGVSTFVVGFGSSADYKTLNAAANAGGTALSGCDPTSTSPSCYYQAGAPSELNAALSSIIQQVVTELCNGDCNIQGSRTCTASGWSPCAAPSEIDCQGPCGTWGKQYCQVGSLTECDAYCEDSGVGGGGGSGGTASTGGSGGTGTGGTATGGTSNGGASGKAGAAGAAGKGGSADGGVGKGGSASGGKGGSAYPSDSGYYGYGGTTADPVAPAQSSDDGGCGCSVVGRQSNSRTLVLIATALAACLLTLKRRRT
jgi:hypothetical protein